MTYIQNKRSEKKSKFKFFVLSLLILFFVLNYFKITPFHKMGLVISGPALIVKEKALSPFDNFFAYFDSKKDLEKQNKELKREIFDLKIEVLTSEVLKYEYQSLKEQFTDENEISQKNHDEIAKVILKPPFSSFDSLTLGGEFADSQIGKKVFYRNVLIGEIIEVGKNIAIVKLASASGNISPAKIKDGNQFEVLGRGNGMYEMTLPKDVGVEVGDPVVFPAEQIVLYGFVNEVLESEDELFSRVLFNIPIDFKDVNYLRIGEPLDVLE